MSFILLKPYTYERCIVRNISVQIRSVVIKHSLKIIWSLEYYVRCINVHNLAKPHVRQKVVGFFVKWRGKQKKIFHTKKASIHIYIYIGCFSKTICVLHCGVCCLDLYVFGVHCSLGLNNGLRVGYLSFEKYRFNGTWMVNGELLIFKRECK